MHNSAQNSSSRSSTWGWLKMRSVVSPQTYGIRNSFQHDPWAICVQLKLANSSNEKGSVYSVTSVWNTLRRSVNAGPQGSPLLLSHLQGTSACGMPGAWGG